MNSNHDQVLSALEQLGTATAADLTQHVPFHETTIRKYLGELERSGKVAMKKVTKSLPVRGAITVKEGNPVRSGKRKFYGYVWRVK